MRLRLTVANSGDRSEELRYAAQVRQYIWTHARVAFDRDNQLRGMHRDDQGRAYFELAAESQEEVQRALPACDAQGRVEISEQRGTLGAACTNCGNIAGPVLPAVCPACGFRDISPCPICQHNISRQAYSAVSGDLFVCPNCRSRVRLRFNSPLFRPDGDFSQPLVIVDTAVPAYEVR